MTTNSQQGSGHTKITRHRLCLRGNPSLVGEAGIECRTHHGKDQDKFRVLWEPRAEGPLPSLEGMSIKEDFL